MARLKDIRHDTDAVTLTFRGNKRCPEPGTGIIRFPGGYVEVTRCSDGTYYVHLAADYGANVVAGLVEYDNWKERYGRDPIELPTVALRDAEHVLRVAVRISGPFVEAENRGVPREKAISMAKQGGA